MSRAVIGLAAVLCAGIATPALAKAEATGGEAAEARCARAAQAHFGRDVTLTRVEHLGVTPATAGHVQGAPRMSALPAHCRIEGIINARKGAGGKDYGIGFAMALPDDWTGRFLLQGGGGLNGSVKPPVGPVASDGIPALARGFAVISHDSGHTGAVFDDTFLADQRAALDFAEDSVEQVALLGKAIATGYYDKPIAHSYMTGCSTGGREGMLAFQRYPELFDGIVVGAPAMRSADSNLGVEYTQVLFNQAAPKDEAGLPILSQVLTDANRKAILAGVLDQCDSLDGLKDGMVENVAQCRFQPARLGCEENASEGCLSPGQVRALELGLAGPRDMAGHPLYARMAADTGIVATPMGYLPTGTPGPFGPPNRATEIDLDARIHAIRNTAWQRLTDTNYWTNLSTYLGRGGKVLFYHGVSDFWFSPFATWDYYERAAEANGTDFTEASRFYMVPGMLHCSGGNSFEEFDLLSAIVAFVEEDKAPEAVTAYRKGKGEDEMRESRPLCPYPTHAAYQGGDPRRAESFTCEPPAEAD